MLIHVVWKLLCETNPRNTSNANYCASVLLPQAKCKLNLVFKFFIHRKTLKFNNFPTVGPNATKPSPCTPLRQELSDGTKHSSGGHTSGRSHRDKQKNKKNKTKQTTFLNGRMMILHVSIPNAIL